MKKGRHRRFEEARALKRTGSTDLDEMLGGSDNEPCAECGGIYGLNQASWCPGAPDCAAAVRAQGAFPAAADDDDVEDEVLTVTDDD